MSKLPTKDRFEKFFIPEPNTGCWLWTGSLNKKGYGRFILNGINKLAHRVSFEMFKNKIPEGFLACHICDVAMCVNPDHIFIGTDMDNSTDKIKKGRMRHFKGDQCSQAKLTDIQVLEIRDKLKQGITQVSLSIEYKVGISVISRVKRRRTWRHL